MHPAGHIARGYAQKPFYSRQSVKLAFRNVTVIRARLAPLLRLGFEYFVAHVATRLLAAAGALLLVRLLPVNEYGFFTIALSAFLFISTASDLGVTETLSYFRLRAAKNGRSWAPYFRAVMSLRIHLFFVGFGLAAIYIAYTASRVGTQSSSILAVTVAVGLAAWFAIQSGIRTYALKLEQRYRAGYLVEIANEAVKLVTVGLAWVGGFATAFAAMGSVCLGAWLSASVATRALGPRLQSATERKAGRRRRYSGLLLSQILPILPGTIHFTLQGPLIALLAAYYGSITNVAAVGALGRLGALIAVVSGFTATVFIPRLLAISDDRIFFRRYLQWWMFMLTFGALVMTGISARPDVLLSLLGSSYSGLDKELLISAATAVIGTWSAFSWHINRARGWARYQIYRVPVVVAAQAPLFYLLDFTTTEGVLWFALGSLFSDFAFQTAVSIIGFYRERMTRSSLGEKH